MMMMMMMMIIIRRRRRRRRRRKRREGEGGKEKENKERAGEPLCSFACDTCAYPPLYAGFPPPPPPSRVVFIEDADEIPSGSGLFFLALIAMYNKAIKIKPTDITMVRI